MNHLTGIEEILDIFKNNFTTAYRGLPHRNKSRLLPYLTCFYRRWLYSALIENTILTPSNLMLLLSGEDAVFSVVAPELTRKNDIRTLRFVSCEYTLDKHPVTKDLEQLISFCSPDAELDDDDNVAGEISEWMRSTCFINDSFYIEYLSLLAFKLGLLRKIPSIHSNRAQPTDETAAFFAAPRREIFDQIVDASMSIAMYYIVDALPMGHKRPGDDYMLTLLREPRTTDEIFDDLYRRMGVNINEFLDVEDESDGLDDIYNAMMSGTFYLGVILDKYFFTVFGYYLKLINPGYILPSDFCGELDYAMDTMKYAEDISLGMFAPCSHYTHTPLGSEFFGIARDDDIMGRLRHIPPGALDEMIAGSDKSQAERIAKHLLASLTDTSDKRIYELKVKAVSNKSYWKNIEFPHTMNLHEVYLFLAFEFGCESNLNYEFYPDLALNPFTAHTSPKNKRRAKKADTTTLLDFPIEERSKFMLVLHDVPSPFAVEALPQKDFPLEIELIKVKGFETRKHYPYVTKISQSFQSFEFDDEWF
jgi:hypothetical protein